MSSSLPSESGLKLSRVKDLFRRCFKSIFYFLICLTLFVLFVLNCNIFTTEKIDEEPSSYSYNKSLPLAFDYNKFSYFTVKVEHDLSLLDLSKHLKVEYYGQLGELKNYHVYRQPKPVHTDQHLTFTNDKVLKQFDDLKSPKWKNLFRRRFLKQDPANGIISMYSETPYLRNKRAFITNRSPASINRFESARFKKLGIADPGFPRQWHFHNNKGLHHDLNVTGLWEEGITGKGVVIAIVDDGIDYEHDDIRDNYYKEGSFDFNKNQENPYPDTELDTHGTRCAGQVAGIRNDACGVGIAYDAKVAGIRILSYPISEGPEAIAINYKFHENHVYSCSWGPPDDGKAMDRPPEVVEDAIKNGALNGRNGKGTVFVFASGNGGLKGDNCNFDGYTNSIYSITVGAIDYEDNHPGYSETCSALMISAYSSGQERRIYTSSSWHNDCTDDHGGTSAAAPMMAGIVALALQVRPDLTWRDLQHISVQSAFPVNTRDPSWSRTWAGRLYSPAFGYGRVDGYRFVHHAKNFTNVGPQTNYASKNITVNKPIPQNNQGISSTLRVTTKDLEKSGLELLEHVTVSVFIEHSDRSDLAVDLISPKKIVSSLIVPRVDDHSDKGFPGWITMSVKHWDEPAVGDWTIKVVDLKQFDAQGIFINWNLTLWGARTKPVSELPSKTLTPSSSSSSVSSSTSISPEIIPTEKATTPPVTTSDSETTLPPAPTDKALQKAKSELLKAAESYRPSSFAVFILCLLGLLLLSIGATALYRYRTRYTRYQQMQELSLLNADDGYALDDTDGTNPDISGSDQTPNAPYHNDINSRDTSNPVTVPHHSEVLFEADDPLLLDEEIFRSASNVLDQDVLESDLSDVDSMN